MKTHTQGQWLPTNDGEANFYGISTKDFWLFRIQQNGALLPQEQEANIKLIAAAPELLKALTLIAQFSDIGNDFFAVVQMKKIAVESIKSIQP